MERPQPRPDAADRSLTVPAGSAGDAAEPLDPADAGSHAPPQGHEKTRVLDAAEITTPPPPRRSDGGQSPWPDPTFKDFKLLKRLGEGAMGSVYRAFQISAGREVALKVILPHHIRNAKVVERFYREARSMGLLDHPHLVAAYEVGEENGCHYFAMEYVDGRTLQQWIAHLGQLKVGDALAIALACAAGLQHAHELGLVHRDVKPANILITHVGQVKLADFGMVKQLDEDLSMTQTGLGIGTPSYMPLEQARNAKDTDARCDIFGLGCTLYCALTGHPPYQGATLVDLIKSMESGMFPPARKVNAEVSDRLDLIMRKACAKRPEHRYQNCGELIRDLEALDAANDRLSFLPNAGPVTLAKPRSDPGPTELHLSTEHEGAGAEAVSAASDLWYVRYMTKDGRVVTRRLSRHEVCELIKSHDFDRNAVASRDFHEGFQPLPAIAEFAGSFQGWIHIGGTESSPLTPRPSRRVGDKSPIEQDQPSGLRPSRQRLENAVPTLKKEMQKAAAQSEHRAAETAAEAEAEPPVSSPVIIGAFAGAMSGILVGLLVGIAAGAYSGANETQRDDWKGTTGTAGLGGGVAGAFTWAFGGLVLGFVVGGLAGASGGVLGRKLRPQFDGRSRWLTTIAGVLVGALVGWLAARDYPAFIGMGALVGLIQGPFLAPLVNSFFPNND